MGALDTDSIVEWSLIFKKLHNYMTVVAKKYFKKT